MFGSRQYALAGVAAALTLAACGGGDGGTGSSNHDDMTNAQAIEVGSAIGGLVNGAFAGASKFEIDDGTLTDPTLAPGVAPSHRDRLVARILSVGALASRSASPAGPALDGGILGGGSCNPIHSNTTDTDEDSIPNDDVLTFTANNCNYVNGFGVTVLVHGSVEIKDAGSIWGFQVNFNSLTYELSNGSGSGTVVITGLYSTTVGANLVNSQEALHVVISNSAGQVINATTSWNLTFTPTTAIGASATALPAGSLTLTGSFSYSHNNDSWSVILTTPDPMVYDGACAVNPVFASGSLEGQIAVKRSHGFHIEFNGCGATPTVTSLGVST